MVKTSTKAVLKKDTGGGFAEIVRKTGLITEADRCISDCNSLIFHLEKAGFSGFGVRFTSLLCCFFSSNNPNYILRALLN